MKVVLKTKNKYVKECQSPKIFYQKEFDKGY